MSNLQYTRQGYEQLQQQLHELKGSKRRQIATQLEQARAHGTFRDNIDYVDAKEQQGMLEAKIQWLQSQLTDAEVIESHQVHERFVNFGCWIEIENLDSEERRVYQIVGELEADLKQKKIAVTAPLIQALLGKEIGDYVILELAQGIQEWEIISIQSTPSFHL